MWSSVLYMLHVGLLLREIGRRNRTGATFSLPRFLFFLYISHIIQLTPRKLSAGPRNSASAEALAVAKRPEEASY